MNQTQRNIVDQIIHTARRDIWVTFQKEGVHMYPGADTDPVVTPGSACQQYQEYRPAPH